MPSIPHSNPNRPVREIAWLLGMCAMLLTALLPFSGYVAALPFIQAEWGVGGAAAGAVYSAYLAGYAVSALLILPATDRIPAGAVFLASAVLSAVGNALFPILAFDVWSASALRFIAGVGLVGLYMPGLRLIAAAFPASGRGAAMGMYVTAFYAANAASLLAAGFLLDGGFEWRPALLILAAASALSVPAAFALTRGRSANPPSSPSSGGGGLRLSVLADGRPRAFVIGYSLHAMELYAVRVWLPGLLAAAQAARGADIAQAAASAATVGGIALAAGAVGPVMGGALSDRFGRARSAMAIFALSGACCLAVGWASLAPWWIAVALACALGWAIAADSSIYSTAIAEAADPKTLGSSMALQAFFGFMGGVAGPIYMGAILDYAPETTRWAIGFGGVSALSVAALVALNSARKSERARPPSATAGG